MEFSIYEHIECNIHTTLYCSQMPNKIKEKKKNIVKLISLAWLIYNMHACVEIHIHYDIQTIEWNIYLLMLRNVNDIHLREVKNVRVTK